MLTTFPGPTFNATYRTWKTGDLIWDYQGGFYPTTITKDVIKDPKWREKVERKQDATNPYSFTGFSTRSGMRSVDWTWHWYDNYGKLHLSCLRGFPLFASLVSPVTTTPLVDATKYRSQVKLAFLAKVREVESPFMAGVFAGELGETIRMIRSLRHPLKKIVKQTRKYRQALIFQSRKMVLRRTDQIADTLGDLYLEWTYGVQPLLADIGAVGKVWNNLMTRDDIVQRISVTIPELVDKSSIYRGYTYWESGGCHVWSTSFVTRHIKVQMRGALKQTVQGPLWDRVQQNVSLNLRDFIPTVYELIPYSFLADYISSLGDCVNGICTNISNLIYVSESVKQTHTGEVWVQPVPSIIGTPGKFPLTPAVGVLEKVTFNRYKADLTVRLTDLRFTPPNTRQMFNMAVLGLSKLRSAADSVLFPK